MSEETETFEQYLQRAAQLTATLMEKRFQLSSVGLSDKIAFDWTKAGLYLEEKKTTGRRKYNAVEYVWLRLVKDLREFGMPYESLKTLRKFLMMRMDMQDLMVRVLEVDTDDKEPHLKELQKQLRQIVLSKEDLKQAFDKNKNPLMDTVLCFIIHNCALHNGNYHLLIQKDGSAILYDGNEIFDKDINAGDILNGPYISYPIRHVLAEFIAREDLMETPLGKDMVDLTNDEKKVLDLLRTGNLVSLSVKLSNKEIKLIETEEEIDVRDVKGKLVDYIKRNSYSEITYKTEKGKIVSMKRKTKHK